MADNRATLKAFFETGDIPTQAQFAALIDGLMSVVDSDTVTGIKTFNSDIILADARVLKATLGDAQLNLRDGGNDGNISLTPDLGQFTQGFLFVTPSNAEIGFATQGDVSCTANGVFISASAPERIEVLLTGVSIGTSAAKIALFGSAPIVQPVAIPDTSGATLSQLEDEVNKIKAAMRSLGSIKT